jgi:glycosyltransferase involved in cell wall biosynthesis
MSSPILDIIAVTYEQTDILKCFINSIKSQTNNNWRLFLVHDGKNQELRLDLEKNGYLSDNVIFIEYPERTMNYGHKLRKWALEELVTNEYVLITNGDNYYTPNMVDEVLKKNEDLIYFDLVHSHSNILNHNKSTYGYMNCELKISNIDMGCVVVKSNVAKSIGFNSIGYAADWDYFNDILKINPSIVKIDKILFVHN